MERPGDAAGVAGARCRPHPRHGGCGTRARLANHLLRAYLHLLGTEPEGIAVARASHRLAAHLGGDPRECALATALSAERRAMKPQSPLARVFGERVQGLSAVA